MTDFTDSHLFDNTPVPFRFYVAEGVCNALKETSKTLAIALYIIFVFSLAGGIGPGGLGYSSLTVFAGVADLKGSE